MSTTGRPMAGSSERVALASRAPRRVHLEGGEVAGAGVHLHLVQAHGEVAEVRGEDVVQQDPGPPSHGERVGELLGLPLLGPRHGRVHGAGVGHVRQQRHGGVAGQEHVVQVRGAVHAPERIRFRAAGRDQTEDHVGDAQRVLAPRPVGHDVVGVDVEDELVPGEGLLARLDVLGGRHLVGPARGGAARRPARPWSSAALPPPSEHAAVLNVARTAATPALVCRNRRRSMPAACAAAATRSSAARSSRRSAAVGGGGRYSPLDEVPVPRGRRGHESGSCASRRRQRLVTSTGG